MNSLVALAWSLKNKELFQIEPVDRPRLPGVQLVDRPRVQPLKRGGFCDPFLLFCVRLQAYLIGIGASICSGGESLCLPYEGFLFFIYILQK